MFWIRRNIPESPRWEQSNDRRKAARDLRRKGAALQGENAALLRFTLVDIFAEPAVRTRLLLTFIMSLSVTIGYWGVSSFVPSYFGSVASAAGLPTQRWVGLVGLVQNIGALLGFGCFGFLADALGRKPTTLLYYSMCLVLTPIVFQVSRGGRGPVRCSLERVTAYGHSAGGRSRTARSQRARSAPAS